MPAAHAAVKHELLVRYLDAWTPAALHRNRRATYVEDSVGSSAGLTALRVFGEFSDLLERSTLSVVLIGSSGPSPAPSGIDVRTCGLDELASALEGAGSPVFACFDWTGSPPSPAAAAEAVSTVAVQKGGEVLLAVPPDFDLDPLPFDFAVRVDLVDRSREAERLVFGTPSVKALEKLKDELWALDEYAGIRYRDPIDAEGTLLDISLQPNVAPLRRALVGHLARTGPVSVASLREWAVRGTIYRATDATRAVQALLTSGTVVRVPTGGRLSPDTVISRSAA